MGRSCCFTGYRPSKFPFSLKTKNPDYVAFENALIEKLFWLINEEDCHTFYTGMAMGFDIIAAEAVALMKKVYKNHNIRLVAAVPFLKQSSTFTPDWKERYDNILKVADETIVLSSAYYSGCYQKRNEYMVDNSDYVLTWWDGKPGGTGNTIRYANSLQRAVINLNEELRGRFSPLQEKIEL